MLFDVGKLLNEEHVATLTCTDPEATNDSVYLGTTLARAICETYTSSGSIRSLAGSASCRIYRSRTVGSTCCTICHLEGSRFVSTHLSAWFSDHRFFSGCDQIASIEEDVVVAFTDPDGEDSNRITVILNKAFKVPIPLICPRPSDW